MLILQDVIYKHPNKDVLFSGLGFSIGLSAKIALIGNNGSGKSTLLKIIAGELPAFSGTIRREEIPYYVPQLFGQYDHLSVAAALRIDKKLQAFRQIMQGSMSEDDLLLLDDDWSIEERALAALKRWQLNDIDLFQPIADLSGGQKTKVFLAGIDIHQPAFVLLDEPGNHLDAGSRAILYEYISNTKSTLLVVSHDRVLLDLLSTVYELEKNRITVFGGNYAFYREQKMIAMQALRHDLHSTEKLLRKAKQTERDAMERQQKLDARGRKKQEKAGLPTISMNTFRNNAEKSTARTKGVHEEKVDDLYQQLESKRKDLPGADKMKMAFDDPIMHKGKQLLIASGLNFRYSPKWLWNEPLSFQINSGERVGIKGRNGSGKTTLIRLLLGELQPLAGTLFSAAGHAVLIDQEYALIRGDQSVFSQAQLFNTGALHDHEVKSRLTKFLFGRDDWDKPCSALSGGERLRLVLCCLTLSPAPPDIIVLDEPTNNLDMQNVEMLINAIDDYRGTLIVISHDAYFLEQSGIDRFIEL